MEELTGAGPEPGARQPPGLAAGSPRGDRRWAERLFRLGPAACAIAVVVLSLVKYGLGVFPSWRFTQQIALHWRHPLVSAIFTSPASHYLLDSPASAVLAGVLHLTTPRELIAFHLLLSFFALAVPFCLRPVRRSQELRLSVSLLTVGGTVPALLLSWVGSYDPVSIASAAVAALTENPVARALAWAVFAFNNAPEAAIGLAAFALVLWADRGQAALPRIVLSLAGALGGYIGIRALTAAWGGGQSQVTMMKYYGFHRYLLSYGYLPLVILSALGVGWLYLVEREARAVAAARAMLLVSLVAAIGMPLIVLDTSRVIASSLWPGMLATAVIVVSRLGPGRARALVARVAPVALALVIVIAWNNRLVYPGWHSFSHVVRFLVAHGPFPT